MVFIQNIFKAAILTIALLHIFRSLGTGCRFPNDKHKSGKDFRKDGSFCSALSKVV